MTSKGHRWLCVMLTVLLFLLPGCRDEDTVTVYCLTGIRYITDGVESEFHPQLIYDSSGNLLKLDYDYACWEYTYDEHGNVLTGTTNKFNQKNMVFTHDDQNRRVTKLEYNQNGTFSRGYRCTYNSQGQKTANIQIEEDGTETGWKETFSYDAAGRMRSWQIFMEEDLLRDIGWVYDDNGNLLEEWQTSMGKTTRHLYSYDSGNKLLSRRTDKSGAEPERYEYLYSDNGRSITELYTKGDQEIPTRRTYQLDENGNLLRKLRLNTFDEAIDKDIWTYDESGNLLSSMRVKNYGQTITNNQWTYDENGRQLTASTQFNGSLGLIRWGRAYRYDASGNLVWSSANADSPSGTKYIYTAYTVPRINAENVQRQQQELLDGIILTAEYEPVIPVLIKPAIAGPLQELFLLDMWQGLSVD